MSSRLLKSNLYTYDFTKNFFYFYHYQIWQIFERYYENTTVYVPNKMRYYIMFDPIVPV